MTTNKPKNQLIANFKGKRSSWIWGTNLGFLEFLVRPLNVSFQSKKAFFRWPLQQIIPTWWTTKSTRTTTEKKCFIARFYKIKEKVRCSFSIFVFVFFICIIMIMNDFFSVWPQKSGQFLLCVFWLFSAIVDDFCIF